MFKPQYTISDATTTAIAEVERLTAHLKYSAIPDEVLKHIRKECLVALTHFSTQIEGNKLSLEQVSGVVEKQKTYGLLRDEEEVRNYFQLLGKTPRLMHQHGKKMSVELIRQCHEILLKDMDLKSLSGKLRTVQNAVYESGTSKLVYLPPEPRDVTPLTQDLCDWANQSKGHPIILAGVFHNQFVTIHPFMDGNGRSARFLSLYWLDILGYDWKQIVPIDRYYAEDRNLYYQLLQQDYSHNYYEGRNETDFTKWIDYYVNGIKVILEGTVNQIELYKTQNILINNRQIKILKYLENNKSITAPQYANRFRLSTRMATRDLKQLVEWNRVSVIGKARATRYFLK